MAENMTAEAKVHVYHFMFSRYGSSTFYVLPSGRIFLDDEEEPELLENISEMLQTIDKKTDLMSEWSEDPKFVSDRLISASRRFDENSEEYKSFLDSAELVAKLAP